MRTSSTSKLLGVILLVLFAYLTGLHFGRRQIHSENNQLMLPQSVIPGRGTGGREASQVVVESDQTHREFPDDPSEAIATIRSRHTSALRSSEIILAEAELILAGEYYASQGIESVKTFILALPPGSNSRTPLRAALLALPTKDASDMITWLSEQQDLLGDESVDAGITALLSKWAGVDYAEASRFVLENESIKVADEYRATLIALALETASLEDEAAESIISFTNSIDNPEIRNRVKAGKAFVGAQLSSNETIELAIEEILSVSPPGLQGNALTSMYSILPKFPNRGEILTALSNVEFEHKSAHFDRFIGQWMQADLNGALSWLGTVKDVALFDSMLSNNWKLIAKIDPAATERWLDLVHDDGLRDRSKQALLKYLQIE